jgi:2C-methyl-D-erythritol 2,4-cyclodiphosphate synthase
MADFRVGTGFDAHALVEGVPLVLVVVESGTAALPA